MPTQVLLIGNEKERRRIYIQSILYIQIDDYLSTFYLSNNQKFICSKPLNEISNYLPYHFFQINRECIVNLNEILSVRRRNRKIIISNSIELVVSTRRAKDFNEALASQSITFAR